MDNKNVKERRVMDFDKFKGAYDQAKKVIMLKKDESAHPGTHPIKGEPLYVRNDANPYKAMGIEHDEKIADINKYMSANKVDVFHDRKLTADEKKKIDDFYGNQTVTHHQMAFILDENVSDEVKKFGIITEKLNYLLSVDKFCLTENNKSNVTKKDLQYGALRDVNTDDRRSDGAAYAKDALHDIKDAELLKLVAQYYDDDNKTVAYIIDENFGLIWLVADKIVLIWYAETDNNEVVRDITTEDGLIRLINSRNLSIMNEEEETETEEEPADKEEEYKAEYTGKTVILNGDSAKIHDEDGIAHIKSKENDLVLTWKGVHEVMSKKDGNFTMKVEKKKEEDKKEDTTDKKEDKKVNEAVKHEDTVLGKVGKFNLIYQRWSDSDKGNGIDGTIRTDPENYYVATIDKKGEISFSGIEAMTRDINKAEVEKLYDEYRKSILG